MAEARPTISVIIPAFNAETVLPRALRSVLIQEDSADEILVIDDGSSDRTAELATAFDPRVRCIRQERAGVAAARNRGIASATGELVAFLDADDEWLPHHLARARAVLTAYPELCWFSSAYEKRELSGNVQRSGLAEGWLEDGRYVKSYLAATEGWTNYTSTMIVRRSVFESVGSFDPELKTAEDLELWLRIGLVHPSIGYSPELSVIIWDTEGSLVTQGLFTKEAAERFTGKCEADAARAGRASDPQVRRFLVKWNLFLLRDGLLQGDRETVRWVADRFGREIPFVWRMLGRACRLTPAPLWSLAATTWRGTRPLRLHRFR